MLFLIGSYTAGELAIAHQIALCHALEAENIHAEEELPNITRASFIHGVMLEPSISFLDKAYTALGLMQAFVPVVETPDELCGASMLRGLRRGATDVICRSNLPNFAHRIRRLCLNQRRPPALKATTEVVVAHEHPLERLKLMRSFHIAGYRTHAAANARDLHRLNSGKLLVATQALWFEAALARRKWEATLVLQPDGAVDQPILVDGSVAMMSDASCPDDVVFAGQDLLRADGATKNMEESVSHTRFCTFRKPGGRPSEASLYRMEHDRVFIRTLSNDAVVGESLWVEFRLPNGQTVHLRGTLETSSSLSDPLGRTPPGFELVLDEHQCPSADLQHFRSLFSSRSRPTPLVGRIAELKRCEPRFGTTYHLRPASQPAPGFRDLY